MAKGMTGLGVLALVGPIVGGLMATHAGWRSTMGILVLVGAAIWGFVWRKLPETLPEGRRQRSLEWSTMGRQWLGISTHPTFRAHAMLTSCTYAGLYVYLALSPFVFIEVLHVSRTAFGVTMATLSLSYLVGTIVCRRMLPTRGLLGTVRIAGWFSLTGGGAMVLLSLWQVGVGGQVSALAFLPGLWLYAFAHGIHQPCGQTGVVAAFPQQAGAASALSGFVLATVAFLVGAVLAWWSALPGWAGTIHPLTLGMGIGGAMTGWTALARVQRHGLPRTEHGAIA